MSSKPWRWNPESFWMASGILTKPFADAWIRYDHEAGLLWIELSRGAVPMVHVTRPRNPASYAYVLTSECVAEYAAAGLARVKDVLRALPGQIGVPQIIDGDREGLVNVLGWAVWQLGMTDADWEAWVADIRGSSSSYPQAAHGWVRPGFGLRAPERPGHTRRAR